MNQYLIYGLGFLGQGLFGARSIVQWYLSERAGRIVSPTLFWVFSLSGSSLFLLYGFIREDAVILLGQTISFYIYVRNLQLKKAWSLIPVLFRILILIIPPIVIGAALIHSNHFKWQEGSYLIIWVGICGQLMLNCRYLYQWYFSEKANESILPIGFWVISAAASVMVVIYSAYKQEPVLLIAQSLGILVYARNIILYWKSRFKHSAQ